MMHKHTPSPQKLILSTTTLALALSSCAFTDTTTETVQNTSDATTDFSSSTSPRSDSKADKETAASVFTALNFNRIREDMAAGGGEHLASLAVLLDIPKARQATFFTLTREKFSTLFSSAHTTPEEMLARLKQELTARPDLRS